MFSLGGAEAFFFVVVVVAFLEIQISEKALMPQNARSRLGVHMFEAGARFSVYGAPEGFFTAPHSVE